MHQVPKATNIAIDTSLKAESILLQELQHLNDTATQINNEISGTYNLCLILAGIIVTGVGTLQTFDYQLRGQGYTQTPILLDVVTTVVLIFGGILSFIFLQRFLQLTEREFHSITAMNKIKLFYIDYLKPQMPNIEEAFYKQRDTGYFSNVPVYIRYTVSLVGSLSFGGAIYVILTYDNLFLSNNLLPLIINIFLSVFVFIISFFFQRRYYRVYMSRFINTPSGLSSS